MAFPDHECDTCGHQRPEGTCKRASCLGGHGATVVVCHPGSKWSKQLSTHRDLWQSEAKSAAAVSRRPIIVAISRCTSPPCRIRDSAGADCAAASSGVPEEHTAHHCWPRGGARGPFDYHAKICGTATACYTGEACMFDSLAAKQIETVL